MLHRGGHVGGRRGGHGDSAGSTGGLLPRDFDVELCSIKRLGKITDRRGGAWTHIAELAHERERTTGNAHRLITSRRPKHPADPLEF